MAIWCEKCGRELKDGERCFEVTVGEIIDDDYFDPYFEPFESTYHLCAKCIKE